MTYLGTFPVRCKHHFAVTEEELNYLVNALAFFHATFDPNRTEPILSVVNEWQQVAADTSIPRLDALAIRLAFADRL